MCCSGCQSGRQFRLATIATKVTHSTHFVWHNLCNSICRLTSLHTITLTRSRSHSYTGQFHSSVKDGVIAFKFISFLTIHSAYSASAPSGPTRECKMKTKKNFFFLPVPPTVFSPCHSIRTEFIVFAHFSASWRIRHNYTYTRLHSKQLWHFSFCVAIMSNSNSVKSAAAPSFPFYYLFLDLLFIIVKYELRCQLELKRTEILLEYAKDANDGIGDLSWS